MRANATLHPNPSRDIALRRMHTSLTIPDPPGTVRRRARSRSLTSRRCHQCKQRPGCDHGVTAPQGAVLEPLTTVPRDTISGLNKRLMAEDRGFEPLRALTQPAFQASALGHYANPPPRILSGRPGLGPLGGSAYAGRSPSRGAISPNSPRAEMQQGSVGSGGCARGLLMPGRCVFLAPRLPPSRTSAAGEPVTRARHEGGLAGGAGVRTGRDQAVASTTSCSVTDAARVARCSLPVPRVWSIAVRRLT